MAAGDVSFVAGGISLNRDRVRNVFASDDSVLISRRQAHRSIREKLEELPTGVELKCSLLIHASRHAGIGQPGHLIAGDAVRTTEHVQGGAPVDVRGLAGSAVRNPVRVNPAWPQRVRQTRTYQVALFRIGGNGASVVQREVPKPARERAGQVGR